MWILDIDKNVVHDLSRPQYECHITKISKERRKKFFTMDGVKRYIEDPLNRGVNCCQHCMPEFFEFDMNSLFKQ